MEQTLEHAADERGAAAALYAPGTTIGHFRVVRELGAGGMGVVFEAYDPSLDRHVAIKLVRDRDVGSAAGVRLVREAQAMAKLAHPNVVPVHEVGTIEGQVFVVMELVRGATLASWLEAPRNWREIVRAFVQAGEGLAAAHRAGLVHRDFKPQNVFLDTQGHARVGDFGLARDDGGEAARAKLAEGSEPTRPAGTPAYMAPEQRAGEPVDARADQYSFAISLQRALSGQRVPRRVRAAVERALAIDPDERFASIGELLDVLRRALDARRRVVVAASTGVAVAALTTAVASWATRPAPDDCEDGAQLVDGLWNPTVRDAQTAKFHAVRPSLTFAGTNAALDQWAGSWQLGRRAACRAEPAQRTARIACLDRDLAELRAQLSVWATADAETAERALAGAAMLPDPAECATSVTTSAAATKFHDRIAKINALRRTGRSAAAKRELPTLLADADGSHDAEVIAQAYAAAGMVERETGDAKNAKEHLARATSAGAEAGDDALMFDAMFSEATAIVDLGRPRDALGLLDAAAAVAARAHIDRTEPLAGERGDALAQAGAIPEALVQLKKYVEFVEVRARRDPSANVALSTALGSLAGGYAQGMQYKEARDTLLRVRDLDMKTYGPDHPELAKTLHDLADAEAGLGNFDVALEDYKKARAIFVAAYGELHPMVATTDMAIGGTLMEQNRDAEARPWLEKSLDGMTKTLPPDHANFAAIEMALGSLERDLDRCKAAIPHFRRSLEIATRNGLGGPQQAMREINLGACLADVKDFEGARPVIENALREMEEANVPMPSRCEAWAVLADIEGAAGHRAKAAELYQRVIDVAKTDPDPRFGELAKYAHEQLAKWKK